MQACYFEPLKKAFSRIGLGCVTFGREIGREEAFGMMDYAFAHGITFFDTAAAYGHGNSERILGEWLQLHKGATDRVIVASKALPPFDKSALEASVDGSLQRLGLDSLDLLYLHRWDESLREVEAIEALEGLVRSGKVRMLGASNFNAFQLQALLDAQRKRAFTPVRSVQNNRNLAVDDVDVSLRNLIQAHQMALVTYSPLGAGFLTGKYAKEVPPATRFSVIPGHQAVYFQPDAMRRAARLQEVAFQTGHSPVQLALAWALHQPDTATVLVGGRTTGQIRQALDALAWDAPALMTQLTDGSPGETR